MYQYGINTISCVPHFHASVSPTCQMLSSLRSLCSNHNVECYWWWGGGRLWNFWKKSGSPACGLSDVRENWLAYVMPSGWRHAKCFVLDLLNPTVETKGTTWNSSRKLAASVVSTLTPKTLPLNGLLKLFASGQFILARAFSLQLHPTTSQNIKWPFNDC
jgi:hypothetical protein